MRCPKCTGFLHPDRPLPLMRCLNCGNRVPMAELPPPPAVAPPATADDSPEEALTPKRARGPRRPPRPCRICGELLGGNNRGDAHVHCRKAEVRLCAHPGCGKRLSWETEGDRCVAHCDRWNSRRGRAA